MNKFLKTIVCLSIVLFWVPGFAQQQIWTVKQCVEQGWKANINVQQSELNKINSHYELERNKASYHPNLNASYTNGFNWGRSLNPTTYQFVEGRVNTNNFNLMANVTIFDGFATPNRIKQSKVGIEIAEGQLNQQKNWIVITIASAYLQILLAYERVELISDQLMVSRELLKFTSKYFDLGLNSEVEVLQIKSQIAKEISDSTLAINNLQLAKLSLMQLMEVPYLPGFEVERFDPEIFQDVTPMPNSDVLYDSAVSFIPEIKNADLNVVYNELDLKVRKANYYPVLSVDGRIGTNYASTSKMISQENVVVEKPIGYLLSNQSETVIGNESTQIFVANDYPYFNQLNDNLSSSLSIVLSIPIYNRKQVKISEGKAMVNIDKAKLDLQNQKNLLRKDIETDYLEYNLVSNQLKASKEKLRAYSVSYEKILKQFELQLSNSYELLFEKNKIATIESEIAQLQYQQLFKNIILKFYQTGKVELPMQ